MQSFRTIFPTEVLAPYVKYYWILQNNDPGVVSERIFSTGSIQLIFHKGEPLFSPANGKKQPQALISGHSIGYTDVISTGVIEMITIVFQPHAARLFFRLPIIEFHGQQVSVDDINDRALSDLAAQVTDTPDNDACIRLIEQFLANRLALNSFYHLQRMSKVIHDVNLHPSISTSQLAGVACFSNKQFNRVFAEYVGTTPKEFTRIIRIQRALYTMQTQPCIDFIQIACTCGFSDQSHMIKEFKLFSGLTPAEYPLFCPPYSDYFTMI